MTIKVPAKIGNLSVRGRAFPAARMESREFANALSAEFDFGKIDSGKKPVAEHADAIILAPFDASDPQQLAYNTLMLRSVVVAKATDRRYHNVPVIIQNLNGCWDAAIKSHIAYAESGYNKEFVRESVHDWLLPDGKIVKTPDVAHLPFQSIDVLNSDKLDRLQQATEEALLFRLSTYSRVEVPHHGFNYDGKRNPEGICVAAVFASASSDKLVDHQNAIEIGRILGTLQMGLRTGGGDQHLMYAPIEGYSQTRVSGRSYLSCVSTHSIVKVETAHGTPPLCDHFELHDTISPRLETLLSSNMYISVGGGDGTGQETGLVLREKLMFPETAGDKMMIFVGQDPSMFEEIRSVLDSEKLEQLQRDSYALADMGIFLFPDAKAAQPTIELGLHEFNRRYATTQTPDALFNQIVNG